MAVGIKVRSLQYGDIFFIPGVTALFRYINLVSTIVVCEVVDPISMCSFPGAILLLDGDFIVELSNLK